MFHSETRRLALALAVVCCTLAALASVWTEQASGSTGCNAVAGGFNLELGIGNTCDHNTTLVGNGSLELGVTSSNPLGIAVEGSSSGSPGVLGKTSSTGANAAGVY